MKVTPKGTRCQGRTKAGKPCRASATTGGLCFFHANPSKAVELGRLGGLKNRHFAVGPADLLPAADNATAVRDTGARAIQGLLSGELHPRVVTALVPLLEQQLRAIATLELAQELAKLRADAKAKSAGEGEPEEQSGTSADDFEEGSV